MSSPLMSQTLRKSLTEWTEVDIAAYYVAVALGVAPDPGDTWDGWGGKKWMFWSANPLGEAMGRLLCTPAECRVLEADEDGMKYRWNQKFDWEKYEAN